MSAPRSCIESKSYYLLWVWQSYSFFPFVMSLLLAIWSDDLLVRYDVYRESREFVRPTNDQSNAGIFRIDDQISQTNVPGLQRHESYFPAPYSQVPGENFFNKDSHTLYILLKESQSIRVRATRTLPFSIVVPSRKSLAETNLTSSTHRLAEILQLPSTAVRLIGLDCSDTNEKAGYEILMEIRPPAIPYEECKISHAESKAFINLNEDVDFETLTKRLLRSLHSGSLEKSFGLQVYALKVRNITRIRSFKNHRRRKKDILDRWKRQSTGGPLDKYLPPFKLTLSPLSPEIALKEPFHVNVTVCDQRGATVMEINADMKIQASMSTFSPGTNTKDLLAGTLEVDVKMGVAFFKIALSKLGSNYRVLFKAMPGKSLSNMAIGSVVTERISVTERPLRLVMASLSLPFDPVEGVLLSPNPGVILIDDLRNSPAGHDALGGYDWTATVKLKYNYYKGKLSGQMELSSNRSNRFIFSNVSISSWGYQYSLVITVTSKQDQKRKMELELGPFDVRVKMKEDASRVWTENFWFVIIELDGNYTSIRNDTKGFWVAFLNFFGTKYPAVRWASVREWDGSIVTLSKLSGSNNVINDTVLKLIDASTKGDLKLDLGEGRNFKVKRAAVGNGEDAKPTKGAMEEGSRKSKDSEASLPMAWIAAIVINGVLVFLFLVFVVYCYCRSKKRTPSNAQTFEKRFEGEPDRMFADKAANHLPGNERAVANGETGRENPVFSVEDERIKMREDAPDRYSSPVERPYSQPYSTRPQSGPYSYPPLYIDDPPVPTVNQSTHTNDIDDDIEDIYQVGLREYMPRETTKETLEEEKPPDEDDEGLGSQEGFQDYYTQQRQLLEQEEIAKEQEQEEEEAIEKEQEEEEIEREQEEAEIEREIQEAVEAEEPDLGFRPTSGDISMNSYHPVDPMLLPAATAIVNMPGTPDSFSGEDWQAPTRDARMEASSNFSFGQYEVVLVSESGEREPLGSVMVPSDIPWTLTHLRGVLSEADDPIRTIAQKSYRFLSEDLQDVTVPEGALIVDRFFPGQEILLKFVEEEWHAPKESPVSDDSDEPQTKTYAVYLYSSAQSTKESIGEVQVPDNDTVTLSNLRAVLAEAELNLNDDEKSTCVFLNDKFEDIDGPEGNLLVDLLYPEQEIILRLESDVKEPEVPEQVEAVLPKATDFKRKELAYVGPLGMCNAPECEKAARVKCLDCGQVGYCSTRHMREDTPVHRRTCFSLKNIKKKSEGSIKPVSKPAWKI